MKIWTNHSFTTGADSELKSLRAELGEHELLIFASTEDGTTGAAADALRAADVAFGQPRADAVLQAENVRWFQVDLAGYTPYDRADFRENFKSRGRIFTNSSSVYVEPCAQHVLAMMMALARLLPESLDNQRGDKAWLDLETRRRSYLLNEQTALILGFGTIGRRIAELLAPLRMNLYGFRRTIAGNEPVAMVSEARIDEILPFVDHVVNVLPANDATVNFLNAERFSKMKPGAVVYNIGRGVTLDQDALLAAMEAGRISAAYLDVTNPEPLPPAHPLWTTPNVYITPHSAGGFSLEKRRHVEHFLANLRRFEAGADLIDRIY